MRITGGIFGGRTILVPKSDAIRPTQDRVREALFNIIGGEISGAAFLDLFAGSGAVGLDALSRGASCATFVESNARHRATMERNIETLLAKSVPRPRTEIIPANAYRWMATYRGREFDIGFADPPYALGEEKGYASVLKTLKENGVIRRGGLFIAEMTAVQKAEDAPDWTLLRDKTYGKSRIVIWRREDDGNANKERK